MDPDFSAVFPRQTEELPMYKEFSQKDVYDPLKVGNTILGVWK